MQRIKLFLVAAFLLTPLIALNSAEQPQTKETTTAAGIVCSDLNTSSARSDTFPCDAGDDVKRAAIQQAYDRALRKAQDECIGVTDNCFVEVEQKEASIVTLDSGKCVAIVGIRWRCCCS